MKDGEGPYGSFAIERRSCADGDYDAWIWTPAKDLPRRLLGNFELVLACSVEKDGIRRFVPEGLFTGAGIEGFIKNAFWGGLAILVKKGLVTGDRQADLFNLMLLLFLYVRNLRSHIGREFLCTLDLLTTGKGENAVPPEFGHWNATDIRRVGRDAAQRAGLSNITNEVEIQWGLIEAARRADQLSLPDVGTIVRSALYIEDLSPELIESARSHVLAQRFAKAVILRKDKGGSAFSFYKRILAPSNTVLSQLIKQKKAPGGVLRRGDARPVMVALGWIGYEYVGQCIHTQMYMLSKQIVPTLTPIENQMFSSLFLKQPIWANLPFLLLDERRQFLAPLIGDLRDRAPDETMTAATHKALWLIARLARLKRPMDRLSNRRPTSLETSAPPEAATARPDEDPELRYRELAESIRKREDLKCECGSGDLVPQPPETTDIYAAFPYRCSACGQIKRIQIPLADLKAQFRSV